MKQFGVYGRDGTLDPPRRYALVESTNIAYAVRSGRPDFANKNVPIELEKLDQPLLGLDAVRGQIEELAVSPARQNAFPTKNICSVPIVSSISTGHQEQVLMLLLALFVWYRIIQVRQARPQPGRCVVGKRARMSW